MTTSIYPVPSICADDQIADWFASLDECLRWNDRKRQKHLDDDPLDNEDDVEPPEGENEEPPTPPDLTLSSSDDTLDSLTDRNEDCPN